jgi:hypothetical protein
MHTYEAHPRKDHRGVDLISYPLPFGQLWYAEPDAVANAIGCAKFRSRSHRAVLRVYDAAGNVIDTHEHAGDFRSGSNSVRLMIATNCEGGPGFTGIYLGAVSTTNQHGIPMTASPIPHECSSLLRKNFNLKSSILSLKKMHLYGIRRVSSSRSQSDLR